MHVDNALNIIVQQKIQLIRHVLCTKLMDNHKQKRISKSIIQQSDLNVNQTPLQNLCINKRKPIHKKQHKIQIDDEQVYDTLSKKKKEMTKQIKRIRQQNRRANHKQYVASLELQLKNKELQIQNLEKRIKELQLQLQAKTCHKCGTDFTEPGNYTPISLGQDQPLSLITQKKISEIQQQNFGHDDDGFRRITDDSSLRICFGNKNLLFFLVTMCCLTMGSIADNPQLFLQPIHPYKVKSQMCYLTDQHKLSQYRTFTNYEKMQKIPNILYQQNSSNQPKILNKLNKISDKFNLKLLFNFLPKQLYLLLSLKDPGQFLLTLSTNNIINRLFQGRNYYI